MELVITEKAPEALTEEEAKTEAEAETETVTETEKAPEVPEVPTFENFCGPCVGKSGKAGHDAAHTALYGMYAPMGKEAMTDASVAHAPQMTSRAPQMTSRPRAERGSAKGPVAAPPRERAHVSRSHVPSGPRVTPKTATTNMVLSAPKRAFIGQMWGLRQPHARAALHARGALPTGARLGFALRF
jgi:hypothetical protein